MNGGNGTHLTHFYINPAFIKLLEANTSLKDRPFRSAEPNDSLKVSKLDLRNKHKTPSDRRLFTVKVGNGSRSITKNQHSPES